MKSDGRGFGVIFDLDGVLVDSGPAHKQAWQDVSGEAGFVMSDDFFQQTFGMQNAEIIPMLFGRKLSREEMEAIADLKERRYRDIVVERLIALEGVESLLGELSASGFVMAVGSSAPRANVELILRSLQIESYFAASVAGEDVARSKPAPDTFLRAAEALSLAPGRCVVVEDAVQGVEAARAAGMPVVAVTNTRSRQDLSQASVVVDSLSELGSGDLLKLLSGRSV